MATTIFSKAVLHSSSALSPAIMTAHMRYPRFIHSELMTHRVFSRNARSSRAVPVKTMLEEVKNEPVIPLHWGKNQRGMQAVEQTNRPITIKVYENGSRSDKEQWVKEEISNVDAWLRARDAAVHWAERFMESGYHKQIVNRILEPFMHIDTLVTATQWANFLWLRDHTDAEPHIEILAKEAARMLGTSTPQHLEPGQWHLPYIRQEDWASADMHLMRTLVPGTCMVTDLLKKISAARCARISYKPFDGNGSIEAELARFDSLIASEPMHASPVEHQATPDRKDRYVIEYLDHREADGQVSRREKLREGYDWNNPGHHGNFEGWIQFRKTLPGECVA